MIRFETEIKQMIKDLMYDAKNVPSYKDNYMSSTISSVLDLLEHLTEIDFDEFWEGTDEE